VDSESFGDRAGSFGAADERGRGTNHNGRDCSNLEEELVKRLFALIVGVAFIAAASSSVLAQGGTAAPKEDKKVDKPAAEPKKPTVQNASGTVKTAAADSLVVAGKAKGGKDAEWTFAVDPKTKIRKAGKDIAATDLAAGDPVLVRYHDLAGKHVAESVMVRTAKKKTEAPKKDETKK
jgi:hypothetical protein